MKKKKSGSLTGKLTKACLSLSMDADYEVITNFPVQTALLN